MDDARLKEVRSGGIDYFDELLERIRDIRASEKRFYQKIRDIYKLAVDYDERDILTNAGQVSKAVADQLALDQYERFNQQRLALEAEQESLADDELLKRYLEGGE